MSKNEWIVRHARRLLQERAADGKLAKTTHGELKEILNDNKDETRKLRAMWTLHATGGLDDVLRDLALASSEYVCAWAVRLMVDGNKDSAKPHGLILYALAETEKSAFVRLHLASALQRMPAKTRWEVAKAMVEKAQNAKDEYLSLMIWYGVESLPAEDATQGLELLSEAKIPLVPHS